MGMAKRIKKAIEGLGQNSGDKQGCLAKKVGFFLPCLLLASPSFVTNINSVFVNNEELGGDEAFLQQIVSSLAIPRAN